MGRWVNGEYGEKTAGYNLRRLILALLFPCQKVKMRVWYLL